MHACFDCAKTFATKSSLKTHTNGFHLGIVHPCNTCGKKFRSLPVLLSHAKLHENVIFECDKCPKKFNTRKYLKQHIENVHTDTVYECDYCDTTLRSHSALLHQEEIHFSRKKACHYCDKKFTPNSFPVHLLEAHNTTSKCLGMIQRGVRGARRVGL